jgi:uncharacterized protein YjbI with pentapeptide repeats
MEEDNIKRKFAFADVIKFIGVIGIVTPLLLGYFQYQRSVQQDKDNYFRVWVEKLSSEKKADRLSAATNLGTYLISDGDYYEEAIDILINTVSIELDYNVLNAIRGSLEKVEASERKRIIQKLLNIGRNTFIYEYPLKTWLGQAKVNLEQSEDKMRYETILLSNYSKDVNKLILNPLAEDLKIKNEIKIKTENDYNELGTHKMLVASFVGLFLNFSRTQPIENLEFFQNSFNYLVWLYFQIPNSRMENSAFSAMTLSDVDLSGSEIIGNTFALSIFSNCSFAGSEIKATDFSEIKVENEIDFSGAKFDDVFFLGAKLKNSNFKGALGLKPIYFYGVEDKDLEYVQFDDEFRMKLDKELKLITQDQFIEYVENSKLIKGHSDELIGPLKKITE